MTLRIQLLSDLHLDIQEDRPDIPKTNADVIVLAGDTTEGDDGLKWAMEQAERLQIQIIYLAGNHEYYGEDAATFDQALKSLCQDHPFVHYLQMDHFDMGNYRIFGTTLWTSFDLEGVGARSMSQWHARDAMDDYRCIYWQERKITPEQTRLLHLSQCQWLENGLKQAEQEKRTSIVVTHHAPHPRSIAPRHQTGRLNPAFASDLSELFGQSWSPSHWFHGHMHDPVDYVQAKVRVLANPRGYPGEKSSVGEFDWTKVIEVD